jgi:hypothetical protein
VPAESEHDLPGAGERHVAPTGLAKWAAAIAILVPGLVVLKEWAYAGLTFLTIGAAWSHLASHQSPMPPIIVLLLVLASYFLQRRYRGEAKAAGDKAVGRGSGV